MSEENPQETPIEAYNRVFGTERSNTPEYKAYWKRRQDFVLEKTKKGEFLFVWQWCDMCDRAYVECPQCGHNSCSGSFGDFPVDSDTPCKVCNLAYEYQDLAGITKKEPTIEECPIAIKDFIKVI